MKSLKIIVIGLVFTLLFSLVANASKFDYQLKPLKVADSTYVFVGKTEDFTFENGGNIVNTGFIVTSAGVVVIDSGPSLRYGQQMKAAIKAVTKLPIKAVLLTHHHPDHFLGNQAFEGTDILALASTVKNIKVEGAGFADNLYVMVGDWMRGTDVVEPTKTLAPGFLVIGEHKLEILTYSGHTSGDMAILDHNTGVLFSGDLIFHKRTLTTPHADINIWLSSIKSLSKLSFNVLVPGHGAVSHNKKALTEMVEYLTWLDVTFKKAASNGLSMNEAMQIKLPTKFNSNALLKQEFSRSVIHLFPSYESEVFKRLN